MYRPKDLLHQVHQRIGGVTFILRRWLSTKVRVLQFAVEDAVLKRQGVALALRALGVATALTCTGVHRRPPCASKRPVSP